MTDQIQKAYDRAAEYAGARGLTVTARTLPYIRGVMTAPARSTSAQNRQLQELNHCLAVCGMLIDLHLPLEREEEDAALAAALLHIYPECFPVDETTCIELPGLELPKSVRSLLVLLTTEQNPTEEEQRAYYARVQENRLALLILLADRGHIVQQLHCFSTWNAHRYIDETKACYYPMCIYGKEHYNELLAPISVLMEKMRSLIEVAEILLRRYEVREAELLQDILALREENATIKGIIAKFRG